VASESSDDFSLVAWGRDPSHAIATSQSPELTTGVKRRKKERPMSLA
jgi:hypothetical protein